MLQVMKVAPADLRKKLFITIRGEEALDYGGVAKLVWMLLTLDTQLQVSLTLTDMHAWQSQLIAQLINT